MRDLSQWTVLFLFLNLLVAKPADAKPPFTDVTKASGIHIADNTGVGGTNAHAVAIEDFNGDGRPDVIIPTFRAPFIRYFRNEGNLRFKDVTKGSGLEKFAGAGTGTAVADFDHDGNLDVYITSLRQGACRLYKGRGDGTFVDVSQAAGVLLKTPARCCAWSDVDHDGWVDLYVTCPNGPNLLFRNSGKGTFTNIAKAAGVELADRRSLGCAFGDVDGDGRDDLFVTSYQSQVSALFKNLGGGKFRDITAQAGLTRKASTVGGVFADVYNRGRLDLYVTTDSWLAGENATESQLLAKGHTVEPNLLYVNNGKGRFTPAPEATLKHKTLSHDAVLQDLDHDGWSEIYVAVDAIPSGNRFATNKGGNPLWTRGKGKGWRAVAKDWGVKHEGNCVCVPAVDFDGDGDLDLLLINFYSNVFLYRNNTDDKQWLRVKAIGNKSNPDGIGAKISVFDKSKTARRLVGFRHVQSGVGYCRSSPLEAHFGLGKPLAGEYEVEVTFPGAAKSIVVTKVKPGQRIIVKQP
jgi:hypothetical protein